jgi:hypothetical protein
VGDSACFATDRSEAVVAADWRSGLVNRVSQQKCGLEFAPRPHFFDREDMSSYNFLTSSGRLKPSANQTTAKLCERVPLDICYFKI